MANIIEIISSAYKSYSANYQKVLSAFAVIAALSLVASFVSSMSDLSDSFNEDWCADKNVGKLPLTEYCGTSTFASLMLGLVDIGVGLVVGLITTILVLALYKPLEEILSGSQVSRGEHHLSSQLGNMIRVYLLHLAQFLAVVFLIMLGASIFYFSGLNWMVALIVIIVGVIMLILMAIAFPLAFTFVNVELVLGKKGLIDAVKNSYALARTNLSDVFLFHLVWLTIGIVVGIATIFTCCFAIFVDPIVSCMILLPVRLCSEILFWKKLKPTT
jgi:hypothetical protein